MNATTIRRLKDAAVLAAQQDDFAAAHELLGFLAARPEPSLKALPLALPSVEFADNSEERGTQFWQQVIREDFLQFMRQHGRTSFTSQEVYSWLHHWDGVCFGPADLKTHKDGRPIWRARAYDALAFLCRMGILEKEYGSKVYYIPICHENL